MGEAEAAMRVVGMLRIKNEVRWIADVLRSIKPLCAAIYVLDDYSDDGTPEICESEGATVYRSEFTGINESRDKTWLLAQIATAESGKDTAAVLCIDGDEILEPTGPDKIRKTLETSPAEAWSLPILYLWDRPDQVRTDGVYGRFRRPSLFRFHGAESFKRTGAGGNFHCSSVPAAWCGRNAPCDAVLLHLGYMHREDRIRKYEWYRKIDPNNSAEDGYRHVVLGDLFPAESRFRWGGPLRLESL